MLGFILVFFISVLFLRQYSVFWAKWRLNEYLKRTIPHPKAHWLYGHLRDKPGLTDPGLEWWKKATAQHPYGFVVLLGPFAHFVVLNHPDLIRPTINDLISTKKNELFQDLFYDWLGINLATANGDDWWRQRKLLTPAFHFKTLKRHCEVFNETADVLLNKLATHALNEQPFETSKHVNRYTLDSILRTSFSFKSGCQEEGESRVCNAFQNLNTIVTTRILERPFLQNKYLFRCTNLYREWMNEIRYLHSLQDDIIKQRQQTVNNKDIQAPNDFLDMLIKLGQDSNGITVQEIKNHINTFIFGGQDTSASTISFLLLSLAKHQDHQLKVREEIDSILDGRDSDVIHWEDLHRLEYLTMCIKESLRLYDTLSPFREITKEVILGNIVLPVGTTLLYNKLAIHHNPEVWGENHEDFDPNRFSKENVVSMNPFAFIPFSAGSRNCIGMNFAMSEIKVVVGRMLRRFNFSVLHEPRITTSVVTRPETEILLKVTERKQ